MSLKYDSWNMNDVMPDDLFFYKKMDIQAFLQKRKCFLATYTMDNGESYSQWLDRECKAVNLNPKNILITLQKEKSLISAKTEPSKKIMDRVLGFGMTDKGDIKKWYGFEKQHTGAINDMIKDFDKYRKKSKQPTRKVDQGLLVVRPLTAFTSLLYEYTPWTGTPDSFFIKQMRGIHGVYLFWLLYKQWWKEDLKNYSHLTEVPKSGGFLDAWLKG